MPCYLQAAEQTVKRKSWVTLVSFGWLSFFFWNVSHVGNTKTVPRAHFSYSLYSLNRETRAGIWTTARISFQAEGPDPWSEATWSTLWGPGLLSKSSLGYASAWRSHTQFFITLFCGIYQKRKGKQGPLRKGCKRQWSLLSQVFFYGQLGRIQITVFFC